MSDTNLVLHLKSGEEVKVIYPNRVFLEYHTPGDPGGVQTSDPVRDLSTEGGFGKKGNFVISTWKNFPRYLAEDDDRLRTIPVRNVISITPADAVDAEVGNRIRQQEMDEVMDKSYKEGTVKRSDLAEILIELGHLDLAAKVLTRPR